jgi:TPR repeat protein
VIKRQSTIAGVALLVALTISSCGAKPKEESAVPPPNSAEASEATPAPSPSPGGGTEETPPASSETPSANPQLPLAETPEPEGQEPKSQEPKSEEKRSGGPLKDGISAFQDKEYRKAYELLFPLALQGNAKAQSYIGRLFMYSYDSQSPVEIDAEKAASWFRKAAAQGEPSAMYYLGELYHSCRQPFCSEEEGLSWYEKAAKLGSVESQLAIGLYYYQKPFLPGAEQQALYWLGQAAKSGSFEGRIALGKAYLGTGPVTADYSKALSYLSDVVNSDSTKPVDTDISEGKYLLGTMYAQGLGVQKNEAKAFELFQSAIKEFKEAQDAGHAGNKEVADLAQKAMEQLGVGR